MKLSSPHHPRFAEELRATARLAAPIVAAQVAQVGMGITDTVLLGGIGRDALAAGGLGAMMFFILNAILQGMISTVAIMIAHARGAGDDAGIAPALRAGYALATIAAAPLMAMLSQASHILLALHEPPELAAMVGPYERILLLGTLPSMWMAVQRAYLSAMGKPQIIMMVAFTALVMNGLLNYGLIHGAFGLPHLGYLGSATATATTLWCQMIAIGIGTHYVRGLARIRLTGKIAWRLVREMFVLGWPISITVGVETLLFGSAGLLMGMLGTGALAAHQITLNVASLLFMVPLGLGQAANVRVGYHAGAGAPRAARRAGGVAIAIGLAFCCISVTTILSLPREIVHLFGLPGGTVENDAVIDLAAHLLLICAAFQVADGVQAIAAGALRGLKDTRTPMILAGIGYWLIGFPTAWILGLHLGWGAQGVWIGLALSLIVVAALLLARFWVISGRAIARAQPAAT